ncbi:MAG TPA: hypothetical protein VGG12_01530 [Methylovirgula sp.]|jgi:hypothetical protein
MFRSVLFLVALLAAAPALAQEPQGCGSFKWPLDQERALLAKASPLASGGALPQVAAAVTVTLAPLAQAKLPTPPSRAPKYPDSYAGFLNAPAPEAGTYRITIAQGAWIDVIQDGQTLKSAGFTGAKGCDGLAKSVKFDLAPSPYVIEVSGTSAHAIALVVTPD